MQYKTGFIIYLLITVCACKPLYNKEYSKPDFTDDKVSRKTRKLHKSLYTISKVGFGIGHQDATAYGIGWNQVNQPEIRKSDVNEVVNDFPAVYGFDISGIEYDSTNNIDKIPFDTMKELIIDAHSNGGIITISWHANNPVTDGDSWDTTPAVSAVLQNQDIIQKYELWLDRIAAFLKELKYKGGKIPIIFRPWHEMNGKWFWWGYPNCTPEDYKKLWITTVAALRDKHKIHNILYTYSPNTLGPEDNYLKHYPGDDYVDLLGIDIYDHRNSRDYASQVTSNLKVLQEVALEKGKLYAFTETGAETIPTPNWFTEILYPSVKGSGISWILFWRNARKSHHYIPYKTHPNASDFQQFEALPETFFLRDLKMIR